ncbi:hypothetical protein FI667_g5399, partial [Globisporangium splendens]
MSVADCARTSPVHANGELHCVLQDAPWASNSNCVRLRPDAVIVGDHVALATHEPAHAEITAVLLVDEHANHRPTAHVRVAVQLETRRLLRVVVAAHFLNVRELVVGRLREVAVAADRETLAEHGRYGLRHAARHELHGQRARVHGLGNERRLGLVASEAEHALLAAVAVRRIHSHDVVRWQIEVGKVEHHEVARWRFDRERRVGVGQRVRAFVAAHADVHDARRAGLLLLHRRDRQQGDRHYRRISKQLVILALCDKVNEMLDWRTRAVQRRLWNAPPWKCWRLLGALLPTAYA